MSTREMVLWSMTLTSIVIIVGMITFASMQNTKTKAEATVLKAQEHTKRAEGRHDLVDFLGLLRRKEEK